jgi:hypothetical protein
MSPWSSQQHNWDSLQWVYEPLLMGEWPAPKIGISHNIPIILPLNTIILHYSRLHPHIIIILIQLLTKAYMCVFLMSGMHFFPAQCHATRSCIMHCDTLSILMEARTMTRANWCPLVCWFPVQENSNVYSSQHKPNTFLVINQVSTSLSGRTCTPWTRHVL